MLAIAREGEYRLYGERQREYAQLTWTRADAKLAEQTTAKSEATALHTAQLDHARQAKARFDHATEQLKPE